MRVFGDMDCRFDGLVEEWAVRSTGFFVGLNTCFFGPAGTGGFGNLADGRGLVLMKAGRCKLAFLEPEATVPLTGLVTLDLALSLV